MFESATPLKFEDHRSLRMLDTATYLHARTEMLAPFVYPEIGFIVREYVFGFQASEPMLPAAVLTVQKGHNAYLGRDGRWLARYVPASIRRYPFALGRGRSASEDTASPQFTVHIDRAAPHFSMTHGNPIFDDAGNVTGVARSRIKLLKAFHAQVAATQKAVQDLADAGLLRPRTIDIQKEGKATLQLGGLLFVDEDRIKELSDVAIATLARSGALALAYAQILSLANLRAQPLLGAAPNKPEPITALGDVIQF